jgi:transcriptional regulator GlxA family with amidase domain
MTRRDFLKTTSAALAAVGPMTTATRVRAQVPASIDRPTDVVIFLYDRMTALDAIGPYEVLRCVPGVRVRLVARTAGLVTPDSGLHMLNAEHGIGDVTSADILLVPGGDASGPTQDQEVLDWIRRIDRTTKWTTSVCVGSLILGAAGLLKGMPATSHWNALEDLRYFGAQPVRERFVRHGKIMTAAGVSAGIDMALQLVAIEYGDEVAKSVQLLIEYDPHPPLQSGSTAQASAETIERARQMLRAMYAPPRAADGTLP